MLNQIFESILLENTSISFSLSGLLACTLVSLLLGVGIAGAHMYKNTYSKGFIVTLALMPAIVQMVIMLVNGNLGTGVAVMGAFSLVRFRSAPGTAREISSIFLAMAVGLATGMGYLGIAVLFVVLVEAASLLLTCCRFGSHSHKEQMLRITIPESLDYTTVFDKVFEQYLSSCKLSQVKTSNMGSLFKLEYRIVMKDSTREKEMIDALRCHNGNLEILCSHCMDEREELL